METIIDFILKNQLILPIIYLAGGITIYLVLKYIINASFFMKAKGTRTEKKVKTIKSLLNNLLKYLIGFITIAAILSVYEVDITSLLAGVGIVGIVIGFSLQDTLKDILAGISIITENQYGVGDIIEISKYKGEVIFLGLKTTRLKSPKGDVKIIANRNITELINYSISDTMAVVNVTLKTTKTVEELENLLEEKALKMNDKINHLKSEIRVFSDTKSEKDSYTYIFEANVSSTKEKQVEKDLIKHLRISLEKEDIESYTIIGDSNGE